MSPTVFGNRTGCLNPAPVYFESPETFELRMDWSAPTQEVVMLESGSQAPEFSVADHDGKVHTLGDYRGRHLVLWFYPRADTPG